MPSSETETQPKVEQSPAPDRAAIKRRRRWLYASAGLALIAVCAFAAIQLFSGGSKKSADRPEVKPPVIVERFEMKAVRGQRGHGLAELVRRPTNDGLRVLAVKLRPNLDEEVYQLLLTGSGNKDKLLGSEIVGQQKTFVGEARISANELHKYTRIELRRVGRGNPPVSKLVLRGSIPR